MRLKTATQLSNVCRAAGRLFQQNNSVVFTVLPSSKLVALAAFQQSTTVDAANLIQWPEVHRNLTSMSQQCNAKPSTLVPPYKLNELVI